MNNGGATTGVVEFEAAMTGLVAGVVGGVLISFFFAYKRSANFRHTLDKLRGLQERWQEQAKALPLERKVEQALWQRFRAACDAIFEARNAKRKEEDGRKQEGRRRVPATALTSGRSEGGSGQSNLYSTISANERPRGSATRGSHAAPEAKSFWWAVNGGSSLSRLRTTRVNLAFSRPVQPTL